LRDARAQGKLNFGSTIDESLARCNCGGVSTPISRCCRANICECVCPVARGSDHCAAEGGAVSAQGHYVWVVGGDKATAQGETGAWVGADWEINDGLRQGDAVIVDNLPAEGGSAVAARGGGIRSARVNTGSERRGRDRAANRLAPFDFDAFSAGVAGVCAIAIVLAGLASFIILPLAQYPDIAADRVVSASHPGASAETIAHTVAAPIEEQLPARRACFI
jgi:hypothetical protein